MNKAKELIVLAFNNEERADEVLKRIEQMITEGIISVFNMAVLVKYKDGKTKIKETQEVGPARGALFGAIMGGLIGLAGGPAGAVIGAVAGATTGGVAALAIDSGFPNEYLRELQAHLQPGSSAVMLLCTQEWSERVIQATAGFQGYVIRHVLKEELAAYLAALGAIKSEEKTDADSPARLEAQILSWQAEIEKLMANLTTGKVITQVESRTQIINLHAKQRRAQDKLYEAWNAEIHACTAKIEALTNQVVTTPEETKAELTSEIEATRAHRRVVREKLYAQVERRIQSWQTEIEDLKKRLAATEMEAGLGAEKRVSALKLFTSVFNEAALPSVEDEVKTRLTALQALTDNAETELQAQLEAQIVVWQEAIRDLQAYVTIPGVPDLAEAHQRIAVLQEQVAAVQTKLKERIELKITTWHTEIRELQEQAAIEEAAARARIDEQIADLQARLETLQTQAATPGIREKISINTRLAALQDRMAKAQAKLKALA